MPQTFFSKIFKRKDELTKLKDSLEKKLRELGFELKRDKKDLVHLTNTVFKIINLLNQKDEKLLESYFNHLYNFFPILEEGLKTVISSVTLKEIEHTPEIEKDLKKFLEILYSIKFGRPGLDKDTFILLFENGYGEFITEIERMQSEKFRLFFEITPQILLKILDVCDKYEPEAYIKIWNNLETIFGDKFRYQSLSIDDTQVLKLIEKNHLGVLDYIVSTYSQTLGTKVTQKLLENEEYEFLWNNRENCDQNLFSADVYEKIRIILFNNNRFEELAENLQLFPKQNRLVLANKLLEDVDKIGSPYYLAKNINLFSEISRDRHLELAQKIIAENERGAEGIIEYINNFDGINIKDFYIIAIHIYPVSKELYLKFIEKYNVSLTREQLIEYLNNNSNKKIAQAYKNIVNGTQFNIKEVFLYPSLESELCK